MAVVPQYRIGIDCRLLGKKHAGIGRYIENLLLEIPHVPLHTKFEWAFIFHDQTQWQEFLKESDQSIFFSQQQVVFAPVRHYTLYEQLHMPLVFSKLNLDILHVPHFNIPVRYKGKIVVTIHDLLWHEYRGTKVTTLPAWKYWVKHGLYKRIVAEAVRKSELIFVPAQTIKQTLLKYFPNDGEKITVTKEGIGKTFLQTPHQHSSKEHRLIYVGSLYPHKNIEVVLQALKELTTFSLDLVGSRNVFQDEVRRRVEELNLQDRVQFLGYKTDQELVDLFPRYFALIQPSLFEGFGLTGVEAMSAGLPVIASDIPVFREIYQERALFFDPNSADSFTQTVQNLANDAQKYQHYTTFSDSVQRDFSWKKMTEQVLESYFKICQSSATATLHAR